MAQASELFGSGEENGGNSGERGDNRDMKKDSDIGNNNDCVNIN